MTGAVIIKATVIMAIFFIDTAGLTEPAGGPGNFSTSEMPPC